MPNSLSGNILCVDDDEDACKVLSATLPLLKFTFAHSFASGLHLIRSGIFDLYFLDEFIPDASGLELCREIRKTDANTPVVMLSPSGHLSDPDTAFAAGASAYLDMPGDFCRLESTVVGLIRQAEARSIDARIAEIEAMGVEIRRHLAGISAPVKENPDGGTPPADPLLKARAYAAFRDSGGVRSHFDRLWPDVLSAVGSD